MNKSRNKNTSRTKENSPLHIPTRTLALNLRVLRALEAGRPGGERFFGLGGGETDHLLFAFAKYACRRQKSYLYIFRGQLNQIPAAFDTELVFNILAMGLDGFYTQV